MPGLLEKLLSPLARAESRRTWPPEKEYSTGMTLSEHWDEVEDYRRRYRNRKAERLAHAPAFNSTTYGKRIYTPASLGREICNFSAEMLFAEPPQITLETNPELLDRVEAAQGLDARLVSLAAMIAAEGRGALRIIRDASLPGDDVPRITHVHEDEVLWDERHGAFVVGGAVIMARTTAEYYSTAVYRLVEEHEIGIVTRTLYKGTSAQLGDKVPLDRLAEFADLQETVETGLDVPTLVRWDNVSGGYSDLEGQDALLDRIDAELSLGSEKSEKSRPLSFADSRMFDDNGKFGMPGILPLKHGKIQQLEQDTSKLYGTIQPEFQAAENISWVNFLIDFTLTGMGYSRASYGRDEGGGVESGTAIKLKQWRTLIKKSGKERMATEALATAFGVALAWEAGATSIEDFKPAIKLSGGVPRDSIETAQEANAWGDAISLEEKIRMRRPDWDDEQVEDEMAKIREQNPAPAPSVPRIPNLGLDALAATPEPNEGNGSAG